MGLNPIRIVVLSLLVVSYSLAAPGWVDYRDPKGIFGLSHPKGWSVREMAQKDLILVAKDDFTYVLLYGGLNEEQATAEAMAQQFLDALEPPFKANPIEQVSTRPDHASVDYQFTNDRRQATHGRFQAVADETMQYGVLFLAPASQFVPTLTVFHQIVASFRQSDMEFPAVLYGGEAEPDDRSDPTNGLSISLPSEWGIEWVAEGCFKAGDRETSPSEGVMLNTYEVTGDYSAPADTMITVLSDGCGYHDVQTKLMRRDDQTAAAVRRRAGSGAKVEAESFFAQFKTPEGTKCLAFGYGVTVVDPGVCGKYRLFCVLYFASEERFDALFASFRETADSIVAWDTTGDLSEELGRGSIATIELIRQSSHKADREERRPAPKPRRQGGGLVDKLSPGVRSR